jgi:hypothetical protein
MIINRSDRSVNKRVLSYKNRNLKQHFSHSFQPRRNPLYQTEDQFDMVNQTPSVGNGQYPQVTPVQAKKTHRASAIHQRHLQERALRIRENRQAARGLFIGILLASLTGVVMGMFLVWEHQNHPASATSTHSSGLIRG